MNSLSNSDKLRSFIAPKMTYLIAKTTLTTSGQRSHHFSPLSYINNDTESLKIVIADLRTRQKSVCECCRRIGHKADACIIRGPEFLPPSLKRNMNHFNALHDDEPNELPREWSIQPSAAHFKFMTSPSNTIPVVSDILSGLIIMPLIMVVLQFTLQIFHFNLILNQFHIHTSLRLDQLMMMKWIISCNSSIQNMMTIFWVLTYK